MNKQTKGKCKAQGGEIIITQPDGRYFCIAETHSISPAVITEEEALGNAELFSKSWNACGDMNDPEKGVFSLKSDNVSLTNENLRLKERLDRARAVNEGQRSDSKEREDAFREEYATLGAKNAEMRGELSAVAAGWIELESGRVRGRQITDWEQERLNFIRDLLVPKKEESHGN